MARPRRDDFINRHAVDIALVLLSEGMLYGKDLETYLKGECEFLEIKDDKEYLKFENLVLDHIQNNCTYISAFDLKTRKTIKFQTLAETMKKLKVNSYQLDKAIKNNRLLKNRYIVKKVNTRPEELAYKE